MPDLNCPCEEIVHPRLIFNPPGHDTLNYRMGDFLSFRAALLRALPGETALHDWQPSSHGDLTTLMLEWWAYLADILTVYNEAGLHEILLQTARLPESVHRIIGLLGYRPNPGIGANGTQAAVLADNHPLTVPAGFGVQSSPRRLDELPQIFEVSVAAVLTPPNVFAALPPPHSALLSNIGKSILLQGAISGLTPGDKLLLHPKPGFAGGFAWVTVERTDTEDAPDGTRQTRLTFTTDAHLPSARANEYRVSRSTQSAAFWPHHATPVRTESGRVRVALNGLYRSITPQTLVLLEGEIDRALLTVSSIVESLWYINGPATNPAAPPAATAIPISQLISRLDVGTSTALTPLWNAIRFTAQVHFGWQDVGTPLPTPAQNASGVTLLLRSGTVPFALGEYPVLIEGADGTGVSAQATVTNPDVMTLDHGLPALPSPLIVYRGLLPVTRGKTVRNEILGSGNAALPNQSFALKKSPLTFLPDPGSASGEGYASTLRIWVNGVEWKEVPSFYHQPPNATVFVTRTDDARKTIALFGDGINGARLPTGIDNVVATYRIESGFAVPEAGTLNSMVQPIPGLQAVRNPLPPGGGSDPDPPDQIRRYAPRSVLTFGRAISADDYETFAVQASGVKRAKAVWKWDALRQQATVTLYVGDDASAVAAAQTALRNATDPNRPFEVLPATAEPLTLGMTLSVEPTYRAEAVMNGVRNALTDAKTGLFGMGRGRIGRSVFRSEILQAALSVPGLRAVHALAVERGTGSAAVPFPVGTFRYDPSGAGHYFTLAASDLTVSQGA